MISTKAHLFWLETKQNKKLGKNRGILKPSWALVEANYLIFNTVSQHQINHVPGPVQNEKFQVPRSGSSLHMSAQREPGHLTFDPHQLEWKGDIWS